MSSKKISKQDRKQWLLSGIPFLFLFFLLLCAGVRAVSAAPGYEDVAPSYGNGKRVSKYGMVPVYGKDIQDGAYQVKTKCSSSFFKILQADLTVKDGVMEAVLTMSSSSYECVYMGTGEEAAKADKTEYIPRVDEEGRHTFTIPVDALNAELDCAAFSVNRQKWYDRKIVFEADSLPKEALSFQLPDYKRIEDAIRLYDKTNGTDTKAELEQAWQEVSREQEKDSPDASETADTPGGSREESGTVQAAGTEEEDGEYSIEVGLTGGSGRASVSSPTWLYVRDGKAYAKLLWSSSYYDYMILDRETFFNETTDGSNSTFTIPITAFEEPVEVIADTTAMGDPLEIEYTLTFYSDTIGDKGKVPQEAAKRVLVYALIIIAGGGILNYFVKKRAYSQPAKKRRKM